MIDASPIIVFERNQLCWAFQALSFDFYLIHIIKMRINYLVNRYSVVDSLNDLTCQTIVDGYEDRVVMGNFVYDLLQNN